ncbi:MAG TPA: DUF5666 domain-containing protein [Deltaproteobacteria bacterium]|jgi:hypothetical protein|nr:DUF5666 domain-containing protein [Deltaproteobacteria bacterium]HOI06524.1 DUF5666 domain-containing protein [Deltaproteobacteria bacterium]
MNRGAYRVLAVVLLLLPLSAGFAVMGAADSDVPGFIRFTGTVSRVEDSRLVVSSRRVDLLDVTYEGKRYQTKILNVDGNPIQPKDIRKGDIVYVWGQETADGTIKATSIHLQIRE